MTDPCFTVADLIDVLSRLPRETEVHIAYDSDIRLPAEQLWYDPLSQIVGIGAAGELKGDDAVGLWTMLAPRLLLKAPTEDLVNKAFANCDDERIVKG